MTKQWIINILVLNIPFLLRAEFHQQKMGTE
jgi:hypothetical protein